MLKRILKWILYILITLILGIGGALYIFEDRIIEQVMVEVNRSLAVPVEVNKVEIDFLHGLPNVAIAFHDVRLPAIDEPILSASTLYAILNPFQIINGEIDIERIEIQDADFLIYIDSDNKNNLSELLNSPNQTEAQEQDSTTAGFSLNAIILKNVRISYINDYSGTNSKLTVNSLNGNLRLENGVYYSNVNTEINYTEHITKSYSADNIGVFQYDFNLSYDTEQSVLDLNNSNFDYRGANAGVNGTVSFGEVPKVDLHINASDIKFKVIAEFLPAKYAKILKEYQSTGSIKLTADLVGDIKRNSMPGLEAIVELNNVDLTEKEFNANIHNFNMHSSLSIKDLANMETASFAIKSGSGSLEERPFKISFNLKNFQNPVYSGAIEGSVTTSWLLGILRYPYYSTAEGSIGIEVDVRGTDKIINILDDLELAGGLEFNEVSFSVNDSVSIDRFDGQVRFDKDKINLTNLELDWLNSDVNINGDIIENISGDGQLYQLGLRSDINSSKLAIEDIVALINGSSEYFKSDSTGDSNLNVDLELIATFDSLTFRRFNGARIAGEILYQDNILEVVDLNGRAMGGAIRLNGKLKEMPNLDIVIQAEAQTKGVNIDSLFYVFNNFNQDFIRQEHLSGRVYADASALMYFDKDWRFRRQLLSSYAKIGIIEGTLIDFEPIMALSDYIDDEDDNLAQLKFSNIVNNIQIKQDTVFIPEMSIQTNVRNIALGGYHTLDQHINYQLAVPIINERVDKDEEFGAVQKSSTGSPNLLFRIKGTTSDYVVNYDLLRATGNVLKLLDITKIFKKKEEAEIDSSFLDDEDFDWQKED